MEDVLQFVWRYQLWSGASLRTDDGRRVSVIDAGEQNRGSGPDFFNAKLMIDSEMWVGNVEVHTRSSEWYRHGHDRDAAYNSVILHVVGEADGEVCREDGHRIPQTVISYDGSALARYNEMVSNPFAELPCAGLIGSIPRVYVADWLTALGMQRLQRKADDVLARVEALNGDWTEAVYVTLSRALGFGSNAEPMERLARAVPLKRLLAKRDNNVAVEGLLMGMGGLLSLPARDAYEDRLVREFTFLSHKYSLTPPEPAIGWQLKVRPHNAPLLRVAALAAYIRDGFSLAWRILQLDDPLAAASLFDVSLSDYWSMHSAFGRLRPVPSAQAVSSPAASLLIINVVAPVIYAYGMYLGNDRRMELATDALCRLRAEDNSVTRLFRSAGIDCRDAFNSQACIQLRDNYCRQRKCLFCRIGRRMIKYPVAGMAQSV